MLVELATIIALAVPTPAPSSSPLKEIIRVTSRPLCTALRDRIGPSVAALLQNDNSIVDATQNILEMGRDDGRPWMQIDKLHLENDISRIVRNLEAIDDLLKTTQNAETDEGEDRGAIEQLSEQLRKVADAQSAELNVLDGTLESEQMSELMNSDLPLGLTSSGFDLSSLKGGEIAADVAAFASPAPSATPNPVAQPTPAALAQAGNTASRTQQSGRLAHVSGFSNTYAALAEEAITEAVTTKAAEAAFTHKLLPLAAQCQRLTTPPK